MTKANSASSGTIIFIVLAALFKVSSYHLCKFDLERTEERIVTIQQMAIHLQHQQNYDVDIDVYALPEGQSTSRDNSFLVYTITKEYKTIAKLEAKKMLTAKIRAESTDKNSIIQLDETEVNRMVEKKCRQRLKSHIYPMHSVNDSAYKEPASQVAEYCFYNNMQGAVSVHHFFSFLGPLVNFTVKRNSYLKKKILGTKIQTTDRVIEDDERELWGILVLFQLYSSVNDLLKRIDQRIEIGPKTFFLHRKYVPGWFYKFGIKQKPREVEVPTGDFKKEAFKSIKKRIKQNRVFGLYSKLNLFYSKVNIDENLTLLYRNGANIRAFALLMVKVLDPRSRLYEKENPTENHRYMFNDYCANEGKRSLPCLLFFDVIDDMLQVPLDFDGEFMRYYEPFVTRLNKIFAKDDFFKESEKPGYISKLSEEQRELVSTIQLKIQAQLFEGLSQYLIEKINTRSLYTNSYPIKPLDRMIIETKYFKDDLIASKLYIKLRSNTVVKDVDDHFEITLNWYKDHLDEDAQHHTYNKELINLFNDLKNTHRVALRIGYILLKTANLYRDFVTEKPEELKRIFTNVSEELGLKNDTPDFWINVIRDELELPLVLNVEKLRII